MPFKSLKNSQLVYSTETGKICPLCENPIDSCTCNTKTPPKGDGIVRVSLDKKGRKGKGVTLITGLELELEALKILAKELKQKCGVGGAVKDFTIEIQGDQRDLVVTLLTAKSFKVKRSGG